MNDSTHDPEDSGDTVPLYLVTEGRSRPAETLVLDVVTLVVSRPTAPRSDLQPEHATIVRMCRSPLSVAELSAYLGLPFSVISVLLADLIDRAHVEAREVRRAVPTAAINPDVETLKALIDGLQRL